MTNGTKKLVTYQQLAAQRSKSTCIYDAFSHITADSKETMGQAVNGRGENADDTIAVLVLAERYGLTLIEAINGQDYSIGFAGLDSGKEFVVVATQDWKIVDQIRPINVDSNNLNLYLTATRARSIFESSAAAVYWHACYCNTTSGSPVWTDEQGMYKNGLTATCVAICFSAPR